MADATVLVLNAGSSSLKFQVFDVVAGTLAMALRGQLDGIGAVPHLKARDASGAVLVDAAVAAAQAASPAAALPLVRDFLQPRLARRGALAGVGHRVVHGGVQYSAPVVVDAAVLAVLRGFEPLAPLHQPHNLAPIAALLQTRPDLPQVACFDTAFHRSQPLEQQLFALPRRLFDEGVRRYGFHGLSYEFLARRLRTLAPAVADARVVLAHLGNGVSMCGLREGRSVATTMGFTALDGCPMGTRTGRLDPGVVLWLMRERGLSADAVEALLYRESGLLGLSGVSHDMRQLLASPAPAAAEAVEVFVQRLAGEAAMLGSALGGLDALVFSGGIGENQPAIRARVCARLAWLGVRIDPVRNAAGTGCISAADSAVAVWVVATDEERMIAEHTARLLGLADDAQASAGRGTGR